MNDASWLVPWGSVSPYNDRYPESKIDIYDTTLRDGEQQAGINFTVGQKVHIYRALEAAGVRYVETGMIATSKEEAAVVERIVADGHDSEIFVLTRALKGDIDRAADSGVDGVSMEILANPVLAKAVFGWEPAEIITRATAGARAARDRGIKVNFFLIDSTRSELAWSLELVGSLHQQGLIDEIILADTFGVADPSGVSKIVRGFVQEFGLPVQMHAHDDYGLAVANSLSAIDAGAEVVHGTLNGLGERAGNADVAQLAAVLQYSRGWDVGINIAALRTASKLVAELGHIPVALNRPVVGSELFDIEAGIAAALYEGSCAEDRRYFYPYLPELVGARANVVLGRGAGLANVRMVLKEIGHSTPLAEDAGRRIVEAVKEMSSELHRPLTIAEFVVLCSAEGVHVE